MRGQFAIGHVDEIGPPQQLLQRLMVGRMKPVVRLIAVPDPVRNRHGAVGRDVQPQHELLQVGAMIFVIAESQLLGGVPTSILPGEGDRCGVVVNSPAVKIKDLDDSHG